MDKYESKVKNTLPSKYRYQVGMILQGALKKEADTIEDYSERMAQLYEMSVSVGEEIEPVFNEIIADELDHINRLNQMYCAIVGVKPEL